MNRKTFLKYGFFVPAGLQCAFGKDSKNSTTANLKYDVVVVGGGPAGFSAAIASAGCGAKTLLVEDSGELGGSGGTGCVNHWLGGRTFDCQKFVVGGIFKRLVLDAEKEKLLVFQCQINKSINLLVGLPNIFCLVFHSMVLEWQSF